MDSKPGLPLSVFPPPANADSPRSSRAPFRFGPGDSRRFGWMVILPVLVLLGAVLSACQHESSPPEDTSPVSDMRIKADWSAWVNKMPPGPPSFHISGTLHMPHPGFEATLTPRRPQGINPKILMMDLKVKELDGVWAQVLTDIEVKYVEDPYEADYDQVHILYPNGDSVFLELTVAY